MKGHPFSGLNLIEKVTQGVAVRALNKARLK